MNKSFNNLFYGCYSLTDVNIANLNTSNITDMSYMFFGCSSLTGQLTLPANVTVIGHAAFNNCSGFTGPLVIPAGVTKLGLAVFNSCSGITNISVDSGNTNYSYVDGILYDKGQTILIYCPAGKEGRTDILCQNLH